MATMYISSRDQNLHKRAINYLCVPLCHSIIILHLRAIYIPAYSSSRTCIMYVIRRLPFTWHDWLQDLQRIVTHISSPPFKLPWKPSLISFNRLPYSTSQILFYHVHTTRQRCIQLGKIPFNSTFFFHTRPPIQHSPWYCIKNSAANIPASQAEFSFRRPTAPPHIPAHVSMKNKI